MNNLNTIQLDRVLSADKCLTKEGKEERGKIMLSDLIGKKTCMLPEHLHDMLGTREEFEKSRLSNCCGAKTTEPCANGLAICRDCHEGCVAEYEDEDEEEDLLGDKLMAEYQDEMRDSLD